MRVNVSALIWSRAFDAEAFRRSAGTGKTIGVYKPTDVIFSQGDASDSVPYIQEGTVKLSVLSHAGKEAVVAMLGRGEFLVSGRWRAIPFAWRSRPP